jgi:hypothetical protein
MQTKKMMLAAKATIDTDDTNEHPSPTPTAENDGRSSDLEELDNNNDVSC